MLRAPPALHAIRLSGKPDYLVKEPGRIVPVEVKPTRRATAPYRGDILQLAGYCLLVEIDYGYLEYHRTTFCIDHTRALRQQLLSKMKQMRRDMGARQVPPSHDERRRCARCGHREHCTMRLA